MSQQIISAALCSSVLVACNSEPKSVLSNDLGPVPAELSTLGEAALKECVAGYEWTRFYSSVGSIKIDSDIAQLYRDVWLQALEIKTSKAHDPVKVLTESNFKEFGVNEDDMSYRDGIIGNCTKITADALQKLGFEVGAN